MKITCIVCPMGCSLDIEEENGEIKDISGYSCQRGKKFAETEFYNPERMVTTVVSLSGGEYPYLPVISDGQVPKEILKSCIHLLKNIQVKAPIKMGDIVVDNILDTGINIIVAKAARMEEK